MYREDETARGVRAHDLISEIATLEREKIARAEQDERLEAARRELASLQTAPPTPRPPAPGVVTHVLVFGVAALATFAGYTLLF